MKTQPTPENIAKLPAWAREHIALLAAKERVAQTALQKYLDGQSKSNIFTQAYKPGGPEIAYIQHDTINFDTPDGVIEARILSRGILAGGLQIRGIPYAIKVMPEAANSIRIQLDP